MKRPAESCDSAKEKKPRMQKKRVAPFCIKDSDPPPAFRVVERPALATTLNCGIRLINDVVMPFVGFGTYKLKKGEAAGPIQEALSAGYRLIDTAQVYDHADDVGTALRNACIPRGDIFLMTKVWRSSHGYERTLKAVNESMRKLGVDYLDLLLVHWPGCKVGWPLKSGTTCPPDWTPAMRDEGTWRAMESLYLEGKLKAIGVSNYSIRHLQQLIKTCKIKPMVLQVEFHPRLVQSDLLRYCRQEGIVFQAYGSLGTGDAQKAEDFFALPPVQSAAAAHGVTPAQVLLRWALEKGAHVIPKSIRPARMAENASIFGFSLSPSEVKKIDALHTGVRLTWKGVDPDTIE